MQRVSNRWGTDPALLENHQRAYFPGYCSAACMQSSIRHRLAGFNPAVRFGYRVRIVPQGLRNQMLGDAIQLFGRHHDKVPLLRAYLRRLDRTIAVNGRRFP